MAFGTKSCEVRVRKRRMVARAECGNIPVTAEMAGVDMRLEEGAYRELHWHKASE